MGSREGHETLIPLASPEVAVALAAAVGDALVLRAWCDAPLRAVAAAKQAPWALGLDAHPDQHHAAASEGKPLTDKEVLERAWRLRHLALLALGDVDALRASVLNGPMVIPHVEAAWKLAVHGTLKSVLGWNLAAVKEVVGLEPSFGAAAAVLPEETWRTLRGLMDTDGLGLRGLVADAFGVTHDAVQAVLDLAEAHPGLRLRTVAPTLQALWRDHNRPHVWKVLRTLAAPPGLDELATVEPHPLVAERLAELARRRDASTIAWLWARLHAEPPPPLALRGGHGRPMVVELTDADVVAAEAARWDLFARMRYTRTTAMAPDLADALWDRLTSAERVQVMFAFDAKVSLPPVWMERARFELVGPNLVRFARMFGTAEDQVDAWAACLRGVADPGARLKLGFPPERPWTALDAADVVEVIRRAEAEPTWSDTIRNDLLDPLAGAMAVAPRDVADGWLVRLWPRLQAFLTGAERNDMGRLPIPWAVEQRLIELHRAGRIAELEAVVDPSDRLLEDGLRDSTDDALVIMVLDDTSHSGLRSHAALEELSRRHQDATCGDVFEEALRKRRRAAVPTEPRERAAWSYVARRCPKKVLAWAEAAAKAYPAQRRDLGAWALCLADLAPPGAAATAKLRQRGLEWLSVQDAAPRQPASAS